MKKHSEIIKEFGLFSLLFVLASAVAVSDNTNGEFTDTAAIFGNDSVWTSSEEDTTHYESSNGDTVEISVTIVETTSSEDVDDTNTGESNDTNTGESTDSEGNEANGNQNPNITPSNSNSGELTYERWSVDEWWEWVLSAVINEDMMLPPHPPA